MELAKAVPIGLTLFCQTLLTEYYKRQFLLSADNFVNSLDPDQDCQNVGLGLDPNGTTL